MSCRIQMSSGGANLYWLGLNDEALQPPDYVVGNYDNYDGAPPLWVCSSMWGASNTIYTNEPQRWEQPAYQTGQRTFKKISGVARDSAGAPLPGATVTLFNTTTNLVVDTQVANSAGEYTLNDPNNTTNFIVGFKAGSPDVAGATDNDLTGT